MIVIERAITLTQPWATLMVIGAKKVETRGWRTNFRGWVAIHAAKSFPDECRALLNDDAFADILDAAGVDRDALPLGQILAVTEIIDCRPTEDTSVAEQETVFGNYAPGRFAIFTQGVRRLKQPTTIRGALSIWRLPSPITEMDLVGVGERLSRTVLNPAAAWPFPKGIIYLTPTAKSAAYE